MAVARATRPPAEVGRQLGRYPDHLRLLAHSVDETGQVLVFGDRIGEVAVLLPAREYRRLREIEAAVADELAGG